MQSVEEQPLTPMKNILVLKHMACQNPGIFRDFAAQCGVVFDEIDLHAGDAIPPLQAYDGLWVMGGSMNVWEEQQYPWLIAEKQAIRQAVLEIEMPFLGICLGHQLLADALGGDVGKAEHYELGLIPIQATVQGSEHPLLTDLPASPGWVNVHMAEVTQAPDGATILASTTACSNHIMAVGDHAFSCQFHPEVCSHTVTEWLKLPNLPETLIELLGEEGYEYFQRDIAEKLDLHNAAAERLFKNWLGLVFPA